MFLGPDAAVVLFDDGFGDGQPQSGAIVAGDALGFGGEEAVKNALEIGRGDARTRVRDGRQDLVVGRAFGTHDDASRWGRVAEGVFEEVGQHLLNAFRYETGGDTVVRQFQVEGGMGGGERGAEPLDDGAQAGGVGLDGAPLAEVFGRAG